MSSDNFVGDLVRFKNPYSDNYLSGIILGSTEVPVDPKKYYTVSTDMNLKDKKLRDRTIMLVDHDKGKQFAAARSPPPVGRGWPSGTPVIPVEGFNDLGTKDKDGSRVGEIYQVTEEAMGRVINSEGIVRFRDPYSDNYLYGIILGSTMVPAFKKYYTVSTDMNLKDKELRDLAIMLVDYDKEKLFAARGLGWPSGTPVIPVEGFNYLGTMDEDGSRVGKIYQVTPLALAMGRVINSGGNKIRKNKSNRQTRKKRKSKNKRKSKKIKKKKSNKGRNRTKRKFYI